MDLKRKPISELRPKGPPPAGGVERCPACDRVVQRLQGGRDYGCECGHWIMPEKYWPPRGVSSGFAAAVTADIERTLAKMTYHQRGQRRAAIIGSLIGGLTGAMLAVVVTLWIMIG